MQCRGDSKQGRRPVDRVTAASLLSTMPLSTTDLVNSSMNSGTPSVRSVIWSAISLGNVLPPVTCAIISARCRGGRRLRLSSRYLRAADPRRRELRAKCDDHEDAERGHPIDQQVEQLARGRVAPVRVLENHQHGVARAASPSTWAVSAASVFSLRFCGVRLERRITVADRDRQQVGKQRRRPR